MAVMQEFCSWFLGELPEFLMSDPIKYIWSLMILAYAFKIIFMIKHN